MNLYGFCWDALRSSQHYFQNVSAEIAQSKSNHEDESDNPNWEPFYQKN